MWNLELRIRFARVVYIHMTVHIYMHTCTLLFNRFSTSVETIDHEANNDKLSAHRTRQQLEIENSQALRGNSFVLCRCAIIPRIMCYCDVFLASLTNYSSSYIRAVTAYNIPFSLWLRMDEAKSIKYKFLANARQNTAVGGERER